CQKYSSSPPVFSF
nr:immunoglobulin light chain junction region [Macaca mulatta]MOV84825.1 immunoglobulin light chain junction region [Macaca mulatta]MOV86133.1 immunoglobulin light chain junction region [Macaca mulatta]